MKDGTLLRLSDKAASQLADGTIEKDMEDAGGGEDNSQDEQEAGGKGNKKIGKVETKKDKKAVKVLGVLGMLEAMAGGILVSAGKFYFNK